MGSAIKTIRYVYDSRGNRKALIDQDGGRFTYTYDVLSRITQVQNPQGDRTSYSYDGANRRTLKKMANGTRAATGGLSGEGRERIGAALPRSVRPTIRRCRFSYDPAGNLTKLYNLKSDGTVLSSFDYAYDKVGKQPSPAEPWRGARGEGGSRKRLSALTSVLEADGSRVRRGRFVRGCPDWSRLARSSRSAVDKAATPPWSYDHTYQLTGEHRTGKQPSPAEPWRGGRGEGGSCFPYQDTYTYEPAGNRLLKVHDGAGCHCLACPAVPLRDQMYSTRDRLTIRGRNAARPSPVIVPFATFCKTL